MAAVKVERHGAVAVLRLDDPSCLNALSPAVKAGMQESVPRVLADQAVRAIVITGTGKAFCAGGDIRAMQDPEAGKRRPSGSGCRRCTRGRKRCSMPTSR